jgi:hypothetical protein
MHVPIFNRVAGRPQRLSQYLATKQTEAAGHFILAAIEILFDPLQLEDIEQSTGTVALLVFLRAGIRRIRFRRRLGEIRALSG